MKLFDLFENNVTMLNRKMKPKMTASKFLLAISDKEYDDISKGTNGAEGTNLFDLVVSYAKKHYPTVEIETEEDVPNHAKELRIIDDDGNDTGWQKNADALKRVK